MELRGPALERSNAPGGRDFLHEGQQASEEIDRLWRAPFYVQIDGNDRADASFDGVALGE